MRPTPLHRPSDQSLIALPICRCWSISGPPGAGLAAPWAPSSKARRGSLNPPSPRRQSRYRCRPRSSCTLPHPGNPDDDPHSRRVGIGAPQRRHAGGRTPRMGRTAPPSLIDLPAAALRIAAVIIDRLPASRRELIRFASSIALSTLSQQVGKSTSCVFNLTESTKLLGRTTSLSVDGKDFIRAEDRRAWSEPYSNRLRRAQRPG
jgi:hypothetical protein